VTLSVAQIVCDSLTATRL